MQQEIYYQCEITNNDFNSTQLKRALEKLFICVGIHPLGQGKYRLEITTEYNWKYNKPALKRMIKAKITKAIEFTSFKFEKIKEEREIYC